MEVSLGLILSLMIIVVTSNSFANGECTGGGLSSGADELTSNTNKVRNRGRTIAKAKIKWSIDLNENKKIAEMFDVSKKELQFMKEGGQWEVYTPTKPVVYTGAYTWNVPRIPCLKYTYRLVVPSKTGDTSNDCFVTRITTLPAESKERIRQAKFIPEKVANVHVGADDSNANVSWSKSLCAEEYQVYLALDDDVEVESKIVPENAEPQAKFSGLSSCTNYVIDIIPNVKGVENEKTIFNHHFHTKPNIASADHLDLSDLVISKDAATLTFYNYMPKVNCLKNFTVQVCPRGKESKNDDCFEDKLEAMDVNLKYSAPNLKHCTNYTLKLTPTYEGININPKMVGFTTKFSEGEEHHSEITESATDVKIAIDNVDCFDSYTISYRLVNNGNNSEWEEEKGDLVTNVIVLDNLSPISTYQIRLDVHDKSGVEKMSVLNTTEITTLRASSGVDRVRSGLEDDDDENKAEDQNPRADNSTSEDNSTETTTPGTNLTSTENGSDESSNEDSNDDGDDGDNGASTTENEGDDDGNEDTTQTAIMKNTSSENDDSDGDDDDSDTTDDANTAGSSDEDDDPTTVIIIVVVVILLLIIGVAVGYWFVKGKKGGAGNTGSGSSENQQYAQVPGNDAEAK